MTINPPSEARMFAVIWNGTTIAPHPEERTGVATRSLWWVGVVVGAPRAAELDPAVRDRSTGSVRADAQAKFLRRQCKVCLRGKPGIGVRERLVQRVADVIDG
jgi:hypothetical protein